MRSSRTITTVDGHTGGEVERVVIGGAPRVPGKTMIEKMTYASANLDDLRRMLVKEPRGHAAMFAAMLTEPTSPEADVGVLFLGQPRFDPMCGHGTVVICTVLVETGMIAVHEPETQVILDTPAGLVHGAVAVKDGLAQSVTFTNVPAFLHSPDVTVDVPGLGQVTVDVAFGGVFYAIVRAESVGLTIRPESRGELVAVGVRILRAANEQLDVSHPLEPNIRGISLLQFTGKATHPAAAMKNTVVWFPPGDVDRSACGTGTCARMATLYARGKLGLNEDFVHESIVGSLFTGRLIEETKVGPYRAVVPTITGSAWITGIHQFLLDPSDPFPTGFELL